MGAKLIPGVNDFETWCKQNDKEYLLDEWDYKTNLINPCDISKYSNKKVNWICRCNNTHKWSAVISSRTLGHGCPYCSGRKVLKGFNDLATTHPELLIEWDYDKMRSYLQKYLMVV